MYKPQSLKPGHGTLLASLPFILMQMLSTTLETEVVNLALPEIEEQFSVSKSTAQWLMTIYYLGTAAAAIPLSRLGDKYGYVHIELFLTAVCGVLYILEYFIENFIVLLIFRLLTGIVVSGMISNRNTMARVLPPPEKAKIFLEKIVIMMNSLELISPFISGLIVDYISWESCFLFSLGCVIIAFVLLFFYTNPSKREKKVKFDILGSILLMLTLSAFCLLFTMISDKMYYIALACAVVSVACGVGFVFAERKHIAPIIPQYIMKNPITTIFGCNIINYMLSTGITYILPQYAAVNGISSSRISLLMVLSSAANLIGSVIIPMMQKRILNRILLVGDYILLIITSILMVFLIKNRVCFIVFVIIMQGSIGVASTILYPITMLSVPPQLGSQVSALPTTGRTIGQSISYCIFSMLQEIVTKNSKKPDEYEIAMVSFQASFLIFIPIALISCFFIWFRIGIQPTEQGKRFFKSSCVRQLENVPMEENALVYNEIAAGDDEKSPNADKQQEESKHEDEIEITGGLENDESSENLD